MRKSIDSYSISVTMAAVLLLGSATDSFAQTFAIPAVTIPSIAHKGDGNTFIWDELMSHNGSDTLNGSSTVTTTPSFSADLGNFTKVSVTLSAPVGQRFEYTHPVPILGNPITPIFGMQLTFNNGLEGDGTNINGISMLFDGNPVATSAIPRGFVSTDGSTLQISAEYEATSSFSFTDWTVETTFSGLSGTSQLNFLPTGGSALVSVDIPGPGPAQVLEIGAVIPEPSSYLMVGSLGLLGFLMYRRRALPGLA